ncbi:MAG: nucleotidyltransferase domain-containing protein [Proteobacteria bacterium]|nr:nucleotidyltransferase domain-containing protein [Pseudomonadota bacterium]
MTIEDFVLKLARDILHSERVLIFGSRARRTNHPRSDYDFAIDAPHATPEQWATFCDQIENDAPSLCKVDLVWLQSPLDSRFRERIEREGVKLDATDLG